MAKDVIIRISAQDAASPVFKKMAAEAKQMGADVEQSAQRSSRSLDDMNKKATAIGGALGTLVGGAALAGRAFVSQEQQLRGLQRAYGESADEIERFADQMQETTVFSDDAARQAAQIASTLQRSYGLTTEQITQLIDRTADLAAVNVTSTGAQFSLADAVSRTSGAIRGEGEAAEALGLTLNDSAVAAEAAAQGLTGWNTTMTESEKAAFRFKLLMEQSTYAMGAAEEAADTNSGQMRQLVNDFQDLAQAAGGALGPLGEYSAVLGDMALMLPLVGAGLGRLAAGLGALGLTGPIGAAGALFAGSALYAQQLNQPGSGVERTTAGALGGVAGFLPSVIPGSFGDALFQDIQSQFLGIINSRDFETAAAAALISPLEDADLSTVYNRLANLLGVAPGTMTRQELEQMAGLRAQAGGYASTGQYLLATAASNPNFTQTPSGSYVPTHVYQEQLRQNALMLTSQINAQATSYIGAPGTSGLAGATGTYMQPPAPYYGTTSTAYNGPLQPAQPTTVPGGGEFDRTQPMAIDARAAPMVNAGDLATFDTALGSLEAYREALRAGRVELELLNGAQMNAADAQLTFKVTQDTLIEGQQEYTGQLSEYGEQLGYIDSAVDLLNQRKADGIALSEEEMTFLDNAAAGQERLQGGVEDATIALGMQALQYADNMKLGDALNESMGGVGDSVDSLTESVNALIETLGGVPPETKAEVTDNGTAAATKGEIEAVGAAATTLDGTNATVNVDADTNPFWASIGAINGSIVGTAYMAVSAATAALGAPGGGMHGLTMMANGGTAFDPLIPRFANGGTFALVGEVGPELVKLSRGDQVMPAGGSRAVMDRGRGRDKSIFVQNLYLYPASPDVDSQIRASVLGEWR